MMKTPKNMLRTLSERSFRINKRRNLVAILAIILTTVMFTTLFVLSQSMSKNMLLMSYRGAGFSAHGTYKGATQEELDTLAKHPDIKSYGQNIVVGIAENPELKKRSVEIRYADAQWAKDTFAEPTTGRMPEADDEIALDIQTLDALGIPQELGQKVTLEWHKDITDMESEPIESEFILCGFWEGNTSVRASMAWVSKAFALDACDHASANEEGQVCGMREMTVTLQNDRNIESDMEMILKDTGLTNVDYGVNPAYDTSVQVNARREAFSSYASMILVFLAGYLIIYNIFQISITSDIQYYGKLKTLGMTKKQIRRLIYAQANKLCLTGIPIGLIIGYLLGMVLVPVIMAGAGGNISISVNPVIFIGSAAFAWLTVIISCMRPAGIAGKVSPMEALRYNDSTISGRKKTKKGKKETTLAGMAWANLGRNRKRTVTVICSLTLGLVLLSGFYAKNDAFDMDVYLADAVIADFQIDDSTSDTVYNPLNHTIDADLLREIQKTGVTETGRLFYQDTTVPLSDSAIENTVNFYENGRLDEMKEYDPSYDMFYEEYQDNMNSKEGYASVYGADGIALKAAVRDGNILSGTYDADKFASGEYVLSICPEAQGDDADPTFDIGEKVTVDGREFTLMAVVSPLESVTGGSTAHVFQYDFIISADVFEQMYPENSMRKYYFNVAEEKVSEMQTMLDQYAADTKNGMTISSKASVEEQYNQNVASASAMGNAISLVIGLVGVLNFLNSMMTSVFARKKEFAMLQSVGMTTKQLRGMLTFEGLDYAVLTLIASYVLSAVSVAFVIRPMVEGGFTTYHFTLLPLVICTPILLVIAVLIPVICFKNIEKQSIVERLRNTD